MAENILSQNTEAPKLVGRDAFDRLELANCEAGYASALCHAVLDTLEKIAGLVGPKGALANDNLLHFARRAETLMLLQQDQIEQAEEGISVAVAAWPL